MKWTQVDNDDDWTFLALLKTSYFICGFSVKIGWDVAGFAQMMSCWRTFCHLGGKNRLGRCRVCPDDVLLADFLPP